MLLNSRFLDYFIKVNNIGSKTHTAIQPLEWHPEKRRFSIPDNWNLIFFCMVACILISFSQFWYGIASPGSVGMVFSCQNVFCCITFLCAACFYYMMLTKREELASLINGFIELEKRVSKKWALCIRKNTTKTFIEKVKFASKLCKVQVHINATSCMAAGLVATLLPSFPLNLAFFMDYYRGGGHKDERVAEAKSSLQTTFILIFQILESCVLFIGNTIAWQTVSRIGVFLTVQVAMSTICLISGLFLFRRLMSDAIHKGSVSIVDESVNIYRQMQILSQLFNSTHHMILAQLLITTLTVQVACLFMIVKLISLTNQESATEFMALTCLYGIVTIDAIAVVLGLYDFMAGVHSHSVLLKADIRIQAAANISRKQNKASSTIATVVPVPNVARNIVRKIRYDKVLKTCPDLRILFALNNFLEKTTSLKFESFVIDKTAALLLIH